MMFAPVCLSKLNTSDGVRSRGTLYTTGMAMMFAPDKKFMLHYTFPRENPDTNWGSDAIRTPINSMLFEMRKAMTFAL